MYKQIEPYTIAFLDSACIVSPVATLQDECGGTCHIIVDDHCYVLCIETEDGSYKPTTHIFKEAFEVIKTLPNLQK